MQRAVGGCAQPALRGMQHMLQHMLRTRGSATLCTMAPERFSKYKPQPHSHRGLVMKCVVACWLLVSCARDRLKSHTC